MEEFDKILELYKLRISKNVIKCMKEKGLNQSELAKKCSENHIEISQGTISSMINGKGNFTLANLLKISFILETDLASLLQDTNDKFLKKSISGDKFIITNPYDSAFKGYLNKYSLYFYKTSGKNMDLLCGTLTFRPSSDGRECLASLLLPTGDSKKVDGRDIPIEKKYEGRLIISHSVRAAYCFLYSSEIGEICLLIFNHWYLFNNDLQCTMASAITTSSGSNRRPTVHRAGIIQGKVNLQDLPYLKGQLLLNDTDIIISKSTYNEILSSVEIPDCFKNILKKAISKESYLLVREQLLLSNEFSETERIKWISYLRSMSIAPKYNTISKRADENMYTLLFKNK